MIFALSYSLANFILYCVQQLGVSLGVGASTILLVAYLQAQRDRVMDDQEKGFALAVRRVMDFGLFCMIVSGIGIVAIQIMQGQSIAVFSTAFIFKWSLMGVVLFMAVANRGSSLVSEVFQGIAGGTWYAIFVIHILAPEAALMDLAMFYGAWLIGFMICWTILVFSFRGRKGVVYATTPRAQTVPPLRPTPSFNSPSMTGVTPAPSDVSVQPTPVEKKPGFFASLFGSKSKETESAPAAEIVTAPAAPQPVPVQLAPRPAPIPSPVTAAPVPQPIPRPIQPIFTPAPLAPPVMQMPVPPPPPLMNPVFATPPAPPIPPTPPSAPQPISPPPFVPTPPPPPVPQSAFVSVTPPSTPMPATPVTPGQQPPYVGLNIMPKNPQDIQKRNTL